MFKVFKRVSWQRLRVSIPYSLLCLILLTDFHKNASFRPNMLIQIGHSLLGNKLQRISYTKWFNEGLHTHSFSRFHAAFSLGRVARAAAVGGPEYLAINSNFRQFCWLHTKTGPSKVGDVVTPPGPWTNFGPLCRWCFLQPDGLSPLLFPGTFWTRGRINIAGISRLGEVA